MPMIPSRALSILAVLTAVIALSTAYCAFEAARLMGVSEASVQDVPSLTALAAAMRRMLVFLEGTGLFASALIAVALHRARALHRFARRDVLTGLQNRLNFAEALAAVLRDPGPANEVALMLLDVDLFKEINDTLGHAAGDLLLKGIAVRLGAITRPGIHISRLGGDEFAILLTAPQAHRAASDMAVQIGNLTEQPFDLGGKPVSVGISIGVALTPLHWCDAETLLKSADIALYAAKAAGRGTCRFFGPKMDRDFRDRRQMEEDLRRAVAEGALDLHFQPLVDLESRAIVGCEALARWDRPHHGFVSPMTFIALAEEIGLIGQIGEWVLRRACAAAKTWPEHVRISINLSPHQFDRDGFVGAVAAVLAETGLTPGRLELEITESLLLRDSDFVLGALADLRAMGVQIALDDFGTGYSSLLYLQRFAIDRIKIDQSFVRNMTRSPNATAIVEAICRLAAKLGVSTTGEGIETEDDAALLRGFGCVEGQGYWFDRPMPLAACTARLARVEQLSDAA